MAAPQWTGGKCKSVQQAKAFFRHNDKDRREEMKHANPHIDKSKTPDNFTYRGLSYKGLCEAFDKKLATVDMGRESSGKNARVVLQSVILYPPAKLPPHLVRAWLMDAGRVLEDRYGDNLLEIQFDMDEQHWYIDPETKEKRLSQHHGHARLFPSVDGKLNAKAFSSRAEIKALNAVLDEMSLQKYGVPMMDGTKKKGGKSAEVLKAASLKAEIEVLERQREKIITDARIVAAGKKLGAERTAQATREDADEYARTTRRKADQDADRTRARADRDAQATRDAAERDKAEAAREVQTMREQLAVMQQQRDAAQAERDDAWASTQDARNWAGKLWDAAKVAKAKRDEAQTAHRVAQEALRGDYNALAVKEAQAGVQSLLEASGVFVRPLIAQKAQTVEVPPSVTPGPVAGSVYAQLCRTVAAMDADSGPTTVDGPTR